MIEFHVNIYVQSLSLGQQCNVQQYGLRLFNPNQNVDDTYYPSMVRNGNGPQIINGIPLAKVAFRLFINLYTTSDGQPPRNIKFIIVNSLLSMC